jgi:hypothetical protein
VDGFCSSPNVRHLSNRFLCPASDGVIIQSRTSSARLGRDRRTRSFALVPYIKIPYVTLFPAMAASLPGICGCRRAERFHLSGQLLSSRSFFTYLLRRFSFC